MNEFELSEEYILDEAYKTGLFVAKKEYIRSKHMLISHFSKLFVSGVDSVDSELDNALEMLKTIHQSESGNLLSLAYLEDNLKKVEASLREVRNIEMMMFLTDKLIKKVYNETEILPNYGDYENFPDQYITKVVLDMIDNLDHDKVQNIVALSVKNSPVRMHKNKIINYLKKILDKMIVNGAYNFTESDLNAFKENLLDVLFPETFNNNLKQFSDLNEIAVSQLYTLLQENPEEIDLESLQLDYRVYITITSYLQSVLEELKYLLVSYKSIRQLAPDFNGFEESLLPDIKHQFIISDDTDFEELIEIFEDYDIYMDLFPSFIITSILFIGSDSNIIHRHELLSEIYILSELIKSRQTKASSEVLAKYELLDEVLNALHAESMFTKISILGEHVDDAFKKKFTEELLDEIEQNMKSDSSLERFYRVNYINDFKLFSNYDDVNFFDYFYTYVDELAKPDMIILSRKLTEIYITYKLENK